MRTLASVTVASRFAIIASTIVSMRLTKKLATLPIFAASPPCSTNVERPSMYARRHVCVPADAEEQRDVDVDALADQLTNRRHAFGRAPAP